MFSPWGYRGDQTTGFQSPTQDHIEAMLNLPALLDLRRPVGTPGRVLGQNLAERGIMEGNILVVDAVAHPRLGKVCVIMLEDYVILAVLRRRGREWRLTPNDSESIPVRKMRRWATLEALVRGGP